MAGAREDRARRVRHEGLPVTTPIQSRAPCAPGGRGAPSGTHPGPEEGSSTHGQGLGGSPVGMKGDDTGEKGENAPPLSREPRTQAKAPDGPGDARFEDTPRSADREFFLVCEPTLRPPARPAPLARVLRVCRGPGACGAADDARTPGPPGPVPGVPRPPPV